MCLSCRSFICVIIMEHSFHLIRTINSANKSHWHLSYERMFLHRSNEKIIYTLDIIIAYNS